MLVSHSIASSDEEPEKRPARIFSVPKHLQIALAFTTVFFPLVSVATILCLFVTIPSLTITNPPEDNANLPVPPQDQYFFFTTVFSNKFTLASSFASNIAQFAAAPFLLLFSFLVALDLAHRNQAIHQDVPKLLRGDQKFLCKWAVLRLWRSGNTEITIGTRIAGMGASISLVLTILLLAGDKLLQGTIAPTRQRVYGPSFTDPDFMSSSFIINSTRCLREETIADIYNTDVAPPCSIDNSTHPWTLWGASEPYRVLATGLLNQTGDYNKEDFNALVNAEDLGTFDDMQLVTHIDPVTHDQHVFFFNPMLSQEDHETRHHNKHALTGHEYYNSGYDYIATTTSIWTQCFPITTDCGMHNSTSDDSSIPYHCSNNFQGNLNDIPTNGVERLKGWNTSFFNNENGSPQNISIASQLNPFHYNVTAVVDSINLGGLIEWNDTQVPEGIVFGLGSGRVGFAISCTSTVYDVTYSLVNGSIDVFNSTPADLSTAAIIKAPLQAGFGSYALYERAAMSVLVNNLTVMDSMELAFSQTFLALAAGVYESTPNIAQRWRGDLVLTQVGKGPFYFLVICLFLYAFVVLVFTVIALSLFRKSDVLELQARLLPKE